MLVFTASFRVACMSVTMTFMQATQKEAVNTSIKASQKQMGQGPLPLTLLLTLARTQTLSLTLTLAITLTRTIARIPPMQARLGMRSFLPHLPFVSRNTAVHC
jgi:hypothetical protein